MMAGQIKNIKTQYLRAFLIFLVILIHSLTNSNNSGERFMIISIRNICNVAVPTFFYLSGYYFNKIKYYKSPKNYIVIYSEKAHELQWKMTRIFNVSL